MTVMAKRAKSINDHMHTCPECGFQAFFMYKDAAGLPLCPKCSKAEIQAFKDAVADLDDDLETYDDESLESWGLDEGGLDYADLDSLETFDLD